MSRIANTRNSKATKNANRLVLFCATVSQIIQNPLKIFGYRAQPASVCFGGTCFL